MSNNTKTRKWDFGFDYIVVLLFLTRSWKHYLYFTCLYVLVSFVFGYFAFVFKFDWKVVTFCFFVGQSLGQIIGGIFTFKNFMNINKNSD